MSPAELPPVKKGRGTNTMLYRWTAEEDLLLLASVETHRTNGRPNWPSIGETFARAGYNRSPQEARHRYARVCKGERARANGIQGNLCHLCGKSRRGHICEPVPGATIKKRAGKKTSRPVGIDIVRAPVCLNDTVYASHPSSPSTLDLPTLLSLPRDDPLPPKVERMYTNVPPAKLGEWLDSLFVDVDDSC